MKKKEQITHTPVFKTPNSTAGINDINDITTAKMQYNIIQTNIRIHIYLLN